MNLLFFNYFYALGSTRVSSMVFYFQLLLNKKFKQNTNLIFNNYLLY